VPRSVMADYAVAGFFAGLNLEADIRDSQGQLTSSQSGYAKIRRMSRERDSVLDVLSGLERARAPRVDIEAAIGARTEEKRHWCDDYGL